MLLTFDHLRAALSHSPKASRDTSYIDTSHARPAGVVLPIIPSPEGPHALFVLRGAHLNDHAGEVGLPGGKPEPEDADLKATALRELGEEIGLFADDIEWLGALSPCPVITGRYMIHPFVAGAREGAAPRVASKEIERLLTLPIVPLLTGELPFHAVATSWRGQRMIAPHFRIGASVLYGASAYIFHELLVLLAAELDLPMAQPILEDAPPWGDRYSAMRP